MAAPIQKSGTFCVSPASITVNRRWRTVFLEVTKAVEERKMKDHADTMDIERERGITIKSIGRSASTTRRKTASNTF